MPDNDPPPRDDVPPEEQTHDPVELPDEEEEAYRPQHAAPDPEAVDGEGDEQ